MQTYQELANSQWLAQADLQHLREAAALLNVVPAIPANADLAQTRTAISTFLNATPNAILPVIPWFDIQPQQQTRRRTQPTNRRRNTNRATSNNIWPWIFGAVVALAFIIAATIIGTRLICNNCGSAPVQTQVVPTQPIVNPTATTAIVSTPIPPTTIPTAACAYNGDPIAPNAYTPANVFVLDETVNYSLKTISSTFYFTSVPVQASIIGQVHHNLWIYCTLDAANKGAQTEFAERSSEALQPGWANGFTVYAPTEGTTSSVIPTAACAYNGDPIAPNAYTPANVFVLDETVNYSLKTISSTFYFTSVPVQASIIGQVHHNLWIYCTLDAANKGAQTEFAERSSEALQPGWANGFTVYAPFGR